MAKWSSKITKRCDLQFLFFQNIPYWDIRYATFSFESGKKVATNWQNWLLREKSLSGLVY